MKYLIVILIIVLQVLTGCGKPQIGQRASPSVPQAGLIPVEPEEFPDLYCYTDVCNVYVLRDGEEALLIDLGNGSIFTHLTEIGVKKVDWVLFTHHHREQCQGYPLLAGSGTKVAVPSAESVLFEQPGTFRKAKTSLGDKFTVYGASYVRPPIQTIPVDRRFSSMDTFSWHGYEFWCVSTPGDSPGGMSYLLRKGVQWFAFSGDVILDGAKINNWFDTEWDHGFGAGIRTLHNSAALLRDFRPELLFPSHGAVIRQPGVQLETYLKKLRHIERLLVRGYELPYSAANMDKLSKPSKVEHLWQVTPHLFKFKGPEYFPNFSLILSDNGHAMVVDCGLIDTTFLSRTLDAMRASYGLKQIDAQIISHIHGDHFLEAPYLKKRWHAPVWVLENMAPFMEHPYWFDLAGLIPAYRHEFDSVHVDRAFKSGEVFDWEGYRFTVDWMPGQTEFALCLHGVIDGEKVAFTGDNIFGDTDNPTQNGHEALHARSSAILEEGYIYGAEYLKKLSPDILMGGHSWVMGHPSKMIDRYRDWAYQMREALRSACPVSDYRYWFDPYWVHAEPYRINVKQGQASAFVVSVRNFGDKEQLHYIEIHTPPGIIVEPAVLEGKTEPGSRLKFPVSILTEGNLPAGVHIIAFDVTLDGKPYGEWFDAMAIVE